MKKAIFLLLVFLCSFGFAQDPVDDDQTQAILDAIYGWLIQIQTAIWNIDAASGSIAFDQLPVIIAQLDLYEDYLYTIDQSLLTLVTTTENQYLEIVAMRQDIVTMSQTIESLLYEFQQITVYIHDLWERGLSEQMGVYVNVVNAPPGYIDADNDGIPDSEIIGPIDIGSMGWDNFPGLTQPQLEESLEKFRNNLTNSGGEGGLATGDVSSALADMINEEKTGFDDPDDSFIDQYNHRAITKQQFEKVRDMGALQGLDLQSSLVGVEGSTNSTIQVESTPVGDNDNSALDAKVQEMQEKIEAYKETIFPTLGKQSYLTWASMSAWEEGLGAPATTRKIEWFDGYANIRIVLKLVVYALGVWAIWESIAVVGGFSHGKGD